MWLAQHYTPKIPVLLLKPIEQKNQVYTFQLSKQKIYQLEVRNQIWSRALPMSRSYHNLIEYHAEKGRCQTTDGTILLLAQVTSSYYIHVIIDRKTEFLIFSLSHVINRSHQSDKIYKVQQNQGETKNHTTESTFNNTLDGKAT